MPIARVLLVDDEPDLRRLAEVSLRRVGKWEVVVCSGGAEALAAAPREKPDLVLLDLLMPPPDGRETLRSLVAATETRTIPVVMMTAGATPSLEAELRALGAAGLVQKPFDPMGLPGQLLRLAEAFSAGGGSDR